MHDLGFRLRRLTVHLAAAFPHTLSDVMGNIYGLANAPLRWCQEACERLIKLGFTPHMLGPMLFYVPGPSTLGVVCILVVHVDDFLIAYSEKLYDPKPLHDGFSWGSMVRAPEPITFTGKQTTT